MQYWPHVQNLITANQLLYMCYKSVISSTWETKLEGLQIQSQSGQLSKNTSQQTTLIDKILIIILTDTNKTF